MLININIFFEFKKFSKCSGKLLSFLIFNQCKYTTLQVISNFEIIIIAYDKLKIKK